MSFWFGNMEDADGLLNWEPDYQQEELGAVELELAQFYSILELETRIANAHKEIARKRDEVFHFKCLLTNTINERDDLLFKCQRLISENLILQEKVKTFEDNASSCVRATHTSYIEDGPIIRVVSSSSSNQICNNAQEIDQVSPSLLSPLHIIDNLVLTKELPEKGKFLRAMMETGPLLQTLLLAGPLPLWQNPPPQLKIGIP